MSAACFLYSLISLLPFFIDSCPKLLLLLVPEIKSDKKQRGNASITSKTPADMHTGGQQNVHKGHYAVLYVLSAQSTGVSNNISMSPFYSSVPVIHHTDSEPACAPRGP